MLMLLLLSLSHHAPTTCNAADAHTDTTVPRLFNNSPSQLRLGPPAVKTKLKRQAEQITVLQQSLKTRKQEAKAATAAATTGAKGESKGAKGKAKSKANRAKGEKGEKKACYKYAEGWCEWGEQCRFSHE